MIRWIPHVVVPAAASFASFAGSATPPVFVEDRAEIPWIVVSSPGAVCGSFKIGGGPKPTRDALITGLAQQKDQTKTTTTKPATALPLLPTPGLWGLEGEVVVAAAELLLRRSGIDGAVSMRIDATGAWLDLPAAPTETAVSAGFSTPELKAIVGVASARLARRHSNVGALALEEAQRFSCHGVSGDPALPSDLGRRLRVRFA